MHTTWGAYREVRRPVSFCAYRNAPSPRERDYRALDSVIRPRRDTSGSARFRDDTLARCRAFPACPQPESRIPRSRADVKEF